MMFHFFTRVLFVIGFIIGVIIAVILLKLKENKNFNVHVVKTKCVRPLNNSIYNSWFASTRLIRKQLSFDTLRYGDNTLFTESQFLYDKISVLCVILVRNNKNAQAANNTWARSCNDVTFVHLTTKDKRKIIPIKKNKENTSWVSLCTTLINTAANYKWILVVNDDTFAIVENLRPLLTGLDESEGHYFGHAVTFWMVTYNMGQAGYVLSRGSLLALKQKFNSSDSCRLEKTYWNQEDMYLGKHLASMNITPSDTRDSLGLSRFLPHNWHHMFFPPVSLYKSSVFPLVCCSVQVVTFQAIEADKIYMYYFLLYKLQIFSEGNLGNKPAPTPVPESEVWQSFLRERGINSTNVSAQEYYELWKDLVDDPTAFAKQMKKDKYDYY